MWEQISLIVYSIGYFDSTNLRPFSPNSANFSDGREINSISFSAIDLGLKGSIRKPDLPSNSPSGIPPTFVAITGTFIA